MVVPLAGRVIAAIVGVLLIYSAARSVIGTLIVPRPVSGWLTSWVDRIVTVSYRMATARMTDHHRRDRLLAGQAPAILLMQLVAWLVIPVIASRWLKTQALSADRTRRQVS